MKKFLKSISLIIAMMMAVTLIPIQTQAAAANKPAMSKKKITITAGKSKTVTVKANGNKITDASWKTSDKAVAKVSKKGDLKAKITGVSEGKTTVTATVKTKAKAYKLKVNVTVKKDKITEESSFADEEIEKAAIDLLTKEFEYRGNDYNKFEKLYVDTPEDKIREKFNYEYYCDCTLKPGDTQVKIEINHGDIVMVVIYYKIYMGKEYAERERKQAEKEGKDASNYAQGREFGAGVTFCMKIVNDKWYLVEGETFSKVFEELMQIRIERRNS